MNPYTHLPTCPYCNKVAHPKKRSAAEHAATLRREMNEVIHYYRCPGGEGWHVGHPVRGTDWVKVKDRMNRSDVRFIRAIEAH